MATEPLSSAVLVTGAAGTVGAYIVDELLRAKRRVIAVDLPGSRIDAEGRDGVIVRRGDLTDLGFCVDAVQGAEAVIHTAATIDLRMEEGRMRRINVDAVRFLYEAARARGCRRFVHFSSGSIYEKPKGPIDESVPFRATSAYERSKVDAERYLWSRDRDGLAVTVVRPAMVYGPRARFLAARLACLPPLLALFFDKIPDIAFTARCNWIHAEDVARAAVFLLDHPDAAWKPFNVADEEVLSFGDVLRTVTEAYGLRVGARVPVPAIAMRVASRLVGGRERLHRVITLLLERLWAIVAAEHELTGNLRPALDREAFDYATAEVIFDTTRLRSLGFRVKYKSLREGYPSVLRWFQENRWVPDYTRGPRGWTDAIGLRFEETMAGTWTSSQGGGARPIRFTVEARASRLDRLAHDGLLALEGAIDVEGLAGGARCRGTLDISPRRRTLVYDLAFDGDDGAPYRLVGQKDVRLLRFFRTMTTLPARVLDARGTPLGDATLTFDLAGDILDLVASLGPVRATSRARETPAVAAV